LPKKLGIGESTCLTVIKPPSGYEAILGSIPKGARISRKPGTGTNLVHVFVTRREDLSAHLQDLRATLPDDAAVWVSWPKKSARVSTSVTEDVIRELVLPLGYVDVKVCAVTEVWSGLKLVVRKDLRTQVPSRTESTDRRRVARKSRP
jgi:hypothetical protein